MKYKRIVVKVGTSTLTHSTGRMNIRRIDSLTRVLSDIKNAGSEVVLVSSGAISVGVAKLGMTERPPELMVKQAMASIGQSELMSLYTKLFGEYGNVAGQILMTRADVENLSRREPLSDVFRTLLDMGVIPVVNENDSVAVEEILYGDNDNLSAIVAVLCQADLTVILSDIDGLFDSDPHVNPDAKLLSCVGEITEDIIRSSGGTGTRRGTGGMRTKIDAAEICMNAGIDMVITNGERPESLYDIVEGRIIGTLFSKNREG